ncbi:ABC transporter permease [Agromyces larvae]|uniref:Lipoprotein ABC transporter permease n=1 Tax=Agromyces larvae TaxID=2929802 RepID=A0ABY4BVD9_9MICO|nr:FtsX-like permease family protein [Agromyces larvae]UOE43177.1 lipoprotein ABC transporter permease [Agromyces larvae]
MRSVQVVMREAIVSALTAPVASLITLVMIAGMCSAVILTSGRTVGAEQAVIGSIDSAGTRSIVIRAKPEAGLDSSVLDRIRGLGGVEWVGAFSATDDMRNEAFPGGAPVPLRLVWADSWSAAGMPASVPGGGEIAWGSQTALDQLGMSHPVGAIADADGVGYAVGGRLELPTHLSFLEPAVFAPQPPTSSGAVAVLVVVAERPDLVAPLATAVTGVLAVDDPTKVTVQTSEALATLRGLIEGQLGAFGRTLTIGILLLTGALAAVTLYGLVMLRRKDFGRRRALGASQRFIVALLVVQSGLVAFTGAVLGSITALSVLAGAGDPVPGLAYVAGLVVLAVAVGVTASLLPAMAAARREPIRELRVP